MTAQSQPLADLSRVPSHVPRGLLVDYDIWATAAHADPFSEMDRLRSGPGIFYTPAHFAGSKGAWVLTKADDIRAVMADPILFSSKGKSGFTALIGETWDLVPLEVDPPEHRQFRAILDPVFSPVKMDALKAGLRTACIELIDGFAAKGECEFVTGFSRPYPVEIFLRLMGLPLEYLETFLGWAELLLRGATMEDRVRGGCAIRDFLLQLIEERRQTPGKYDDVTSYLVESKIDGKPIVQERLIGLLYLLFIAGLDTTTSTLGFCFRYLAEHPEEQRRLRADPSLIPAAVEELLRAYSVVVTGRLVTQDTTVGGVAMKKGDWIVIGTMFGSRDPGDSPRPEAIDFDRPNNKHMAFATGVHRCMGSHLARREIAIAIEEWTQRLPTFSLKPGITPEMHGNIVFGVDYLPLVWDVP